MAEQGRPTVHHLQYELPISKSKQQSQVCQQLKTLLGVCHIVCVCCCCIPKNRKTTNRRHKGYVLPPNQQLCSGFISTKGRPLKTATEEKPLHMPHMRWRPAPAESSPFFLNLNTMPRMHCHATTPPNPTQAHPPHPTFPSIPSSSADYKGT